MMSVVNRKISSRHHEEVMDAFMLFDKDKDNRVNSEEIKGLILSLGGDVGCPHVRELVMAANKSDGGSLDLPHFLAQWNIFKERIQEEEESEEEIRQAFREYDVDGDGYISKDEMVQALKRMGFVRDSEEEAEKCMREMDLDNDGKVS